MIDWEAPDPVLVYPDTGELWAPAPGSNGDRRRYLDRMAWVARVAGSGAWKSTRDVTVAGSGSRDAREGGMMMVIPPRDHLTAPVLSIVYTKTARVRF